MGPEQNAIYGRYHNNVPYTKGAGARVHSNEMHHAVSHEFSRVRVSSQ